MSIFQKHHEELLEKRDGELLVAKFIQMSDNGRWKPDSVQLENLSSLLFDDIWAVHYADLGAQGDAGVVEILYRSQEGLQVLKGNYASGNLSFADVIEKLPMIKGLSTRSSFELPYPYGGRVDIPTGWGYLYMGALNHLFARRVICDKATTFIEMLMSKGRGWQTFDAIAWFCREQHMRYSETF